MGTSPPTAPPASSTAAGGAGSGSAGWPGAALIAAGSALLATGSVLLWQRLRGRAASAASDDGSGSSSARGRERASSNVVGPAPAPDVASLEAENLKLRRLLSQAEAVDPDVDELLRSRSDGAVKMTTSERETLKAIFELFDQEKTGHVKASDLQALHKKLGEPLTDEESAQAIDELDKKKRGYITFDDFMRWWLENHRGSTKQEEKDRYRARFKLLNAKLVQSEFQTERVVVKEVGPPVSTEYRVVFNYKQANGLLKPISPWHDIPLFAVGKDLDAKVLGAAASRGPLCALAHAFSVSRTQIFNFVCEVPKWTRAKFEIATGELYNPIKQDVKNGKLRFYKYGDMLFNYGAFPQTWEDPAHVPEDTKAPGDNDPIDVIEIGTRQLKTGSITPVKVLGVLALIDDGETDWKVLAININDPLAHLLNDVDDIDAHIPGAIDAIREYLRVYKVRCAAPCASPPRAAQRAPTQVVDGKPENTYALRGEAMRRDYAIAIVEDTHKHWQELSRRHQTTVNKPN